MSQSCDLAVCMGFGPGQAPEYSRVVEAIGVARRVGATEAAGPCS